MGIANNIFSRLILYGIDMLFECLDIVLVQLHLGILVQVLQADFLLWVVFIRDNSKISLLPLDCLFRFIPPSWI